MSFNGLRDFGSRLRAERERLGLSQMEAADRSGVRRQMWGKYERDEAVPGVDVVAHFCSHGADIQFLLTGKRPEDQPYRPPLNIGLFLKVVDIVNEEMRRTKRVLEAERRERLIEGVYEFSLQTGEINARALKAMLAAM